MSELDAKLEAIFRAAFPALDGASVRSATRDSVEAWDSIAAVTLASLVEEEYGPLFDIEEAAEWTSYEQVRRALAERLGA